jgi:hypothetical protein
VRDARGRSYEGSGIGLALVQELAKLHGGAVRVESEVDRGSRFTVSVPLGRAHLSPDRIRASHRLASTSLQPTAYLEELSRWLPEGHPQDIDDDNLMLQHTGVPAWRPAAQDRRQILLADDNADMRAYVSRLLGGRFNVHVFSDGESALAAVRARKPDLILAGDWMPIRIFKNNGGTLTEITAHGLRCQGVTTQVDRLKAEDCKV